MLQSEVEIARCTDELLTHIVVDSDQYRICAEDEFISELVVEVLVGLDGWFFSVEHVRQVVNCNEDGEEGNQRRDDRTIICLERFCLIKVQLDVGAENIDLLEGLQHLRLRASRPFSLLDDRDKDQMQVQANYK